MIDEQSLRRPTFADGVKIRLCDGQEWTFPKPMIGFIPEVGPEGLRFSGKPRYSFGADYNVLIDRLTEAEGGEQALNAQLNLGFALLSRNYNLPDEILPQILAFWPNDQANADMWEAITNVALGRDTSPKPSPVG